ncbi:MAG: C40 family peptidase [Flavobacteriaceae bacterium]|nr:C40 family peptidase [Flavobacteriaceae bacterium]
MKFGICLLNIAPLRKEADDRSEMVSQVLFGEYFTIIDELKNWSYIRLEYDLYEGWIDRKQYELITAVDFKRLNQQTPHYAGELIDFLNINNSQMAVLSLGATLPFYDQHKFMINLQNFTYDGSIFNIQLNKKHLINIAFMYLNSPYLWGGKTPFGIDCSGFTQMVYKLCGYYLDRDSSEQAKQGVVLNFLEESEPGDLAFFDNSEGKIIHVGILIGNEQIIHASGKVRIDFIDHSGIFNKETKKHTHKLRLIKQIIS